MQSCVGNCLVRFFNGLKRDGIRSGLKITSRKVKYHIRGGVGGNEDIHQVAAAVVELGMKIKDAILAVDAYLQEPVRWDPSISRAT